MTPIRSSDMIEARLRAGLPRGAAQGRGDHGFPDFRRQGRYGGVMKLPVIGVDHGVERRARSGSRQIAKGQRQQIDAADRTVLFGEPLAGAYAPARRNDDDGDIREVIRADGSGHAFPIPRSLFVADLHSKVKSRFDLGIAPDSKLAMMWACLQLHNK